MQLSHVLLFFLPLAFVLYFYLRAQKKDEHHNIARLNEAIETGMSEPPSLHPVFKPDICIGCGACVPACPEHAIGIIGGKGALVAPTKCIGHGACKEACPVDGISLVFGTEKRGVDIPQVNPNFETNVKGIFIAGELGGMGLIRKTTLQGTQAIAHIAKHKGGKAEYDVIIIGAGPAGIAASLAAKEKGMRYVTIEQEDSLGGAVYHYPRNKLTMTAPVVLPLVGEIKMYDIRKEDLLNMWKNVVNQTQLQFNFNERMEKIAPSPNGFTVTTSQGNYETTCVLLAIGRRGTPRKLDVAGENQAKVVYRLIDAEQYRGQHVLVVGGGDSALEAAISLAEEVGTTVTLSYRGEAFGRVKQKNLENLTQATSQHQLTVLLSSQVKEIKPSSVVISYEGTLKEIKNDAVIICAGGVLPTPFLKEIGIMVETHHGEVVS